jgi:hypothetical protein
VVSKVLHPERRGVVSALAQSKTWVRIVLLRIFHPYLEGVLLPKKSEIFLCIYFRKHGHGDGSHAW